VPGIEERHVTDLETWMDEWNEELEPLKSFILPGGDMAAAQLHVARTVCRRAERIVIALSREEQVGAQVIPYLNRLSDFLFVASRHQAKLAGIGDILWDSRAFGFWILDWGFWIRRHTYAEAGPLKCDGRAGG
jgi:cob(I)alamin adenosyltransferase